MEEFFYVLLKYLQDIKIEKNDELKKFLDKYMVNLNKNKENKKLLNNIYEEFINIEEFRTNTSNKIYRLKSIFSNVNFDDEVEHKKNIYKNPVLQSLSSEYIYPNEIDTISEKDFAMIIKSFMHEINLCKNEEQIFYVFKKYFSCIPVKNVPNCYVSLFNTAKIISAIYSCVKSEINLKENLKAEEFGLLKADVSGIQDFIFSISSKEAAKSLKGRSVYINILTDVISKYIVGKLGLSLNNILYNGGGNFYIIIPKSKINEVDKIRKYISKVLLKAHKGKIYIAIGVSTVSCDGELLTIDKLKDISKFFSSVSEKVASLKNRKWNEIGIEENFEDIFGPIDNGNNNKKICSICGSVLNNSDEEMCEMCKSFVELTDEIKKAEFYSEEQEKQLPEDNSNNINIKEYKDVFKSFGFEIKFKVTKSNVNFKKYLINNTDFLRYDCDGYIFKSFNLPQESIFEKIVSFNIEKNNIGDKKLGVLKLDVDNLGKIFIKGLKTNEESGVSIGQIIELSNAISLFFEGYLNELIKNDKEKKIVAGEKIKGENWDKTMYVVYAGGDDTFILGAYNEVFEFSYVLRKSFERYVCNNKHITFSAGLGLFPYKYPVVKCANYTEQFLDEAKMYVRKNDELPQKNSVCLFGEIFKWDEFEEILEIRNNCIDIYKLSKNRAFLQKILNSTKGFKSIMSDISSKEKINIAKVHRLAYYLRELRNSKSEIKDMVENLVKTYEKMIVNSILNKSHNTCNIMVIPAGVRWAELNTKKMGESGE
ncbi:type III-A CRISPR-associated protein Cas10/Csm1 [Clostridium sp. cel8]|nr:type III-A CRISPR-associated protein Cas10/Csm1 [Clostridium sp. cel8]